MSITFPFELLLVVWATSMVGLIWWSSADAASLPAAATRGELYASRLHGIDFWTHVTETDLARTAARAEGHPVTPEDASERVLASPLAVTLPGLRVTEAKRCHLSGYGYVLVTCTASASSSADRISPAADDILRVVVYANGEIGDLVPQHQNQQAAAVPAAACPAPALTPAPLPEPELAGHATAS